MHFHLTYIAKGRKVGGAWCVFHFMGVPLFLNMKDRQMSFYSFLSENYELSCYLPKKLPADDTLNAEEMEKLVKLMNEKDFYEINTIIRKRYSQN